MDDRANNHFFGNLILVVQVLVIEILVNVHIFRQESL
jgi:hypothetical protein